MNFDRWDLNNVGKIKADTRTREEIERDAIAERVAWEREEEAKSKRIYENWCADKAFQHSAQYFLDTCDNGFIVRDFSQGMRGHRIPTYVFQSKVELLAWISNRFPDYIEERQSKSGTTTGGGN